MKKSLLSEEQQKKFLHIAKESVEAYVSNREILDFKIKDECLKEKGGAFVTLHKDGELRGCIGQIMPSEKPLWQVVRDMSISAATKDFRFKAVDKSELKRLTYEISVLSSPKRIDNWHDIILGEHGVIIKKGKKSGVFLPQVAIDTGWSLEKFLEELCKQKAGLRRDCYKNKDIELYTFTAQVFK